MRQSIALAILFCFGFATDGISAAYGMTAWAIIGAVCIVAACLLAFWPERVRR